MKISTAHLKINSRSEENFQRSKTRHLLSMNHHEIHHKLPAIYHAVAPQIPATPLKNTSKRPLFSPPHYTKK
jgi:hypothetical protein